MPRRRISDLEGRDAYELLGVTSTASEREIRRGYRKAMFAAHPDRGGAEHLAKLINAAHELLLDDRASYDRHRLERAAPVEPARPPAPPPPETDGYGDWWGRAGAGQPVPRRPWQDDGDDGPDDDLAFTGRAPSGARDLSWAERLLNAPTMLGGLLVIGVVVGVIAAMSGSPAAGRSTGVVSGATIPSPTWSAGAAAAAEPVSTPVPAASGRSTPADPAPGRSPGYPDHLCAVSKALTLWCSGANEDGQLGVGDTDQHARAVTPLPYERWRSVTTGRSHTCAITKNRELYCWGDNSRGQLGTADGRDLDVPVRISARSWRSVAAAHDLTCGVRTDHRLYCWGTPSPGAGGDRPPGSAQPRLHTTISTWTSVTVDGTRLCAARPGHAKTCFDS